MESCSWFPVLRTLGSVRSAEPILPALPLVLVGVVRCPRDVSGPFPAAAPQHPLLEVLQAEASNILPSIFKAEEIFDMLTALADSQPVIPALPLVPVDSVRMAGDVAWPLPAALPLPPLLLPSKAQTPDVVPRLLEGPQIPKSPWDRWTG
eukprot:CAMPEP_0117681322 /NCGR_PEP_ID=MMETSP0804-20121206/18905_1 /TAXON_ID=1074897 /ORGANISM="Tetraselmis astigmatica, Strain CCMP880" /LENGTH=149 /DNA_ID=CAMNT_0005491041 /DNA_START=153 /DNA_END=602 /DNA_ORIENTATION=+